MAVVIVKPLKPAVPPTAPTNSVSPPVDVVSARAVLSLLTAALNKRFPVPVDCKGLPALNVTAPV